MQLLTYLGNGYTGQAQLDAHEARIGRPLDGILDFLPQDSWASLESDAAWCLPPWGQERTKRNGAFRLCLSVPLTVNGTSLADVAAGRHDSSFAKVAALLKQNGHADAWVRIGWEMNGGWYPWAMKGHEQDYANAFAHVSRLFKAALPACRIVWCPSIYMNQQWPDAPLPDPSTIDVMGLDAYNEAYPAQSDPKVRWGHVYGDSWGVNNIVAIAKKYGKPYAFPEWGTGERSDGPNGGGDDAYFVQQMAQYVQGAEFAGYWDYPAADYNAAFVNHPKALAAYKAMVGTMKPAVQAAAVPLSKLTATASDGATVQVTHNADGSDLLRVTFPPTKDWHHYTIWLSESRHVETWGRMSQLGWDTTGGTATVHVAAN